MKKKDWKKSNKHAVNECIVPQIEKTCDAFLLLTINDEHGCIINYTNMPSLENEIELLEKTLQFVRAGKPKKIVY